MTSARADSPEEMKRFDKGGTILKLEDVTGSKVKRGTIRGVFEAPPEKVWEIITDFSHYKDFMPRYEESVVQVDMKSKEKHIVRYHGKLNMPWPIADVSFDCNVEMQPEKFINTFELIPGTGKGVKEFNGTWKLEPFKGDSKRTLATYVLFFEADRWYPRWAVNMGTKQSLGKVIEAIRTELKKRKN